MNFKSVHPLYLVLASSRCRRSSSGIICHTLFYQVFSVMICNDAALSQNDWGFSKSTPVIVGQLWGGGGGVVWLSSVSSGFVAM